MFSDFFELLIEILLEKSLDREASIEIDNLVIDDNEVENVYNQFVERLAQNIFIEAIGDELVLEAFMNLSRLEKIIVVFNVMPNYKTSQVAVIANTTSSSVSTQKYKAIKHLQNILGVAWDIKHKWLIDRSNLYVWK